MIYKSCVIMDLYPRKKLKYTKITNFIILTAVSNVYTAMLVTIKWNGSNGMHENNI